MAAEELPGFIPRILRADDVSLLRADETDIAVVDATTEPYEDYPAR